MKVRSDIGLALYLGLIFEMCLCRLISYSLAVNPINLLGLQLNYKKSVCMLVGPHHLVDCVNITTLNGNVLVWVKELRYLGVYSIVSSSKYKCNFSNAKKAFYDRSFNAILGRVGRVASEEVVIQLIKAKCLPVLLYGIEVCPVNVSDMRSLEFTFKRIMIKLFRTYDSGVINSCMLFFVVCPMYCDSSHWKTLKSVEPIARCRMSCVTVRHVGVVTREACSCLSVCLSAPKRLKIRTSNLAGVFPGIVPT